MMIWFTADTHFRHANIIGHCNRPFDSVDETDQVLLRNINECVKPNDTLYHLGDFSMSGRGIGEVRPQIKCRNLILILGNHDPHASDGTPKPAFTEHFSKVAMMMRLKVRLAEKSHQIILCHYAMQTWPRSHYGSWHLHGHSHGTLPPAPSTLDVGVDCHGYWPFSLDDVVGQLRQQTDRARADDPFGMVR